MADIRDFPQKTITYQGGTHIEEAKIMGMGPYVAEWIDEKRNPIDLGRRVFSLQQIRVLRVVSRQYESQEMPYVQNNGLDIRPGTRVEVELTENVSFSIPILVDETRQTDIKLQPEPPETPETSKETPVLAIIAFALGIGITIGLIARHFYVNRKKATAWTK